MRHPIESCPTGPMKFQRPFQVVLLLAAVDSLLYGLWACLWPEGLFTRLQPPDYKAIQWTLLGVPLQTEDHVLLWRAMGMFFLAHALILVLVAWRPSAWGSLVVTPLIGRAVPLGVWLWLLGMERVRLQPAPLCGLAAHDGVWVVMFLAFLAVWRYGRSGSPQALPAK